MHIHLLQRIFHNLAMLSNLVLQNFYIGEVCGMDLIVPLLRPLHSPHSLFPVSEDCSSGQLGAAWNARPMLSRNDTAWLCFSVQDASSGLFLYCALAAVYLKYSQVCSMAVQKAQKSALLMIALIFRVIASWSEMLRAFLRLS